MDRNACDLSRPQDLPRIIREARPDIVVNAAAYTAVDKAEEEEALATMINGAAVGVIAEETRKLGALLIHYSTDYVFDGTKDTPYTEDDAPHPINAYGRSKLAGERAIEQCGADYLILRTSWIYAARGRNFLEHRSAAGARARRAAHRGRSNRRTDLGARNRRRHRVHCTAGSARARKRRLCLRYFNVTAAGETSWFGFAQAIIDYARPPKAGRKRPKIQPISSLEYPTAAARPKNSRLAEDRVAQRFGVALMDWKSALKACIKSASFDV